MSTELTKSNGASAPVATQRPAGLAIEAYSQSEIELLKNTVAQGASDLELKMFLEIARATGLNPFKKEIWFIKTKSYTDKNGKHHEGRVQIMTGIDGFFRIANENPNYDGIEHSYGPYIKVPLVGLKEAGPKEIDAPEWVESTVYRKDRTRPERRRCYWREYAQDLVSFYGKMGQWANKPTVMLEKCADATALRKAFPQELGHFYAPEEMPKEYSAEDEERKSAAENEAQLRANYIKQQTAKMAQSGDYVIEHGSQRGSKVSAATNSIWLERHLVKHAAELPEQAKHIIQARIDYLKREHAQRMAAQAPNYDGSAGDESRKWPRGLRSDDGWTPTPEEAAEIAAREQQEQGDE